MELVKWQNVIVDWVNCLNISKPVQSISDLKNENFFRKLLLLLTLNQNDSTDSSEERISLTDFLKKHYPAYSLEVEPTLIQDDVEICYICSLLLHYCCFIDGRQDLTAPLCKDLNTASQFQIKSFLEELHEAKEITRDFLNDVISNINKYPSTPTRQLKNSPLASPKIPGNTNTLLDFLKTPLKKQQLYDSHKREIKHLQAQLDLERFEKADLQEELNLQYEKNKKLDKVIFDKQSEISRLRSELLSLESRTPPSNTKIDGRLENKRLRDEIVSLEKYIEILHKEQEELQNERDKARNKLRKVEETCNEWQNRALNTERHCSKISEENEQQRSELIQLREKCEELSSILKEINSKNMSDESYEIDHMPTDFLHNRSGSIDYESLAHTVVDVQLIDAQEENKNLRKQLGDLEVSSAELIEKLNELRNEITKLMDENKYISESKNKLIEDILDTENKFKSCQKELKQKEDLNTNLSETVTKLQGKLSETDFNLTYFKNENEKLTEDKKVLDGINKNLNELLNNKSRSINDLLSEKTNLLTQIDDCNKKILEYESKDEFMTDFLHKLDKILEYGFIKFESVITELSDGNFHDCDSLTKLENLIRILESKIQKDTKDFYHFQENCKSLTSKIYNLQEEVKTLYNNEMQSQKEKNALNISLQDAKSKMEQLINDIDKNHKIILKYKSTIEEKSNEINALENTVLEKVNSIEELNREQNNLKASIRKMDIQLSLEKNEKYLFNEKVAKLETSLKENLSTLQTLREIIDRNNVDIENYKKDIEYKNNQIFTLKDTITNINSCIEELNTEKCDLLNKLKNIQSEFLAEKHTKELANIEINNIKTLFQKTELKIKKLETCVQERLSDIDILKNTIVSNEQTINKLKQENNNFICNLELTQNNLINEKQAKEKINNELCKVKSNLAEANSKIQILETTIEDNYKLVEKLEAIIERKTNEYNDIIFTKEKYIENLNVEKNNIITSLKSVEIKLSEEKKIKILAEELCEKLKEEIKGQEKLIKNLEAQKTDLQINLQSMNTEISNEKINKIEIEKKCNQLQNVIVEIEQQMKTLVEDKIKLNEQLESLKGRIDTEVQNYEILLNENDKLKQLNSKKDSVIQNLETQKDSLNANIQKVEKELKNAESSNNHFKSKLDELINDLDEKEKYVLDFQMEQAVLQEHITTLEGMLEEETKQKLQLDIKLKNLVEAINEKDILINSLKSEKENFQQQIEILNNNLTTQDLVSSDKIGEHIQKIQELQKEICSLNEKFNMLSIEVSTIVNMLKTEEDMQININLDESLKDCDPFVVLSKTIVNLKNNICSLIFEKRRLDNETTNLQQQISAAENLKSAVEEDCKKLAGELSEKKTKLTETNQSLQSSVEYYKSHNEQNKKKINEFEIKLEAAAKDTEKLVIEHFKEIDKYKDDVKRISEQNEANIKRFLSEKTEAINELIALKLQFKETLACFQANVQDLKDMKAERDKLQKEKLEKENNFSKLSEDYNALTLKLDHSTNECTKLTSCMSALVIEVNKCKEYIACLREEKESLLLQLTENNENYEKLKSYSIENENKIKEKDSTISEKEQKINELNIKLAAFTDKMETLRNEKNMLDSQISEYKVVVQEIEKSQSNMSLNCNRVEKQLAQELEFKKEMENLLSKQEDKVNSFTKQLTDLSSDHNNLIDLCKDTFNKFHSLYTVLFKDKEDEILQQISTFKNQEKHLKTLINEKELVCKEYDYIAKEVLIFKENTFKELSNYEVLKTEFSSLKSKYDHLIVCATENNTLKTQLSEIENKLSDSQLENTKYQNQISEREVDYKNMKSRYEEELTLMKSTCNNWQKIINENETEHKKLQNEHKNIIEKYDSEMDTLRKSNVTLEDTVSELQQNIKNNNNIIIKHQIKYEDLIKKYQAATEKISCLDPEIISLQDKIADYEKAIANLENDNTNFTKKYNDLSEQYKKFTEKCKQEHEAIDKDELAKLRTVYTHVMTENSHLQLECTVLKKTIEERNKQLSNLTIMKDEYEKLLEENNKMNMELDTLRYKRARDKEEFKRVLEEDNTKSHQQIQEVRNEYEEKLKKMKDKIVKLYKEEVEKEKKKVCTLQQGQTDEIIASLKSQLWMTGTKYVELKKENEKLREQLQKLRNQHQIECNDSRVSDIQSSRESVCSLKERRPIREIEDRRTATLPRDIKPCTSQQSQQIDIIEESVTFSRKRRSITTNLDPGLKMEDEEGEIFNNTYLADLKAGRCVVSSDSRDSISSINSTSSRMSELQMRNSLCPPHLKSSYPAETQFSSPGQFKEEDIKTGTIDLDDSMSSSLLPGEKPRNKKDWGQTLYKKPGPPTPSKNGGRLSLQGNEVHPREVLREHNSGRSTSTPSRLKALFTRSGTASRDSENISSTPRGQVKRRSIFRK